MSAPDDIAALQARLDEALGTLTPEQREVLLAVRLDDRSYFEIAECTALSLDEVERLMAQALYRLAHAMRDGSRRSWRRRK